MTSESCKSSPPSCGRTSTKKTLKPAKCCDIFSTYLSTVYVSLSVALPQQTLHLIDTLWPIPSIPGRWMAFRNPAAGDVLPTLAIALRRPGRASLRCIPRASSVSSLQRSSSIFRNTRTGAGGLTPPITPLAFQAHLCLSLHDHLIIVCIPEHTAANFAARNRAVIGIYGLDRSTLQHTYTGPFIAHPSVSPPSPSFFPATMVRNLLALIVWAAPALSAVVRQQSPVNVSQECTNPVVRREWRSHSKRHRVPQVQP